MANEKKSCIYNIGYVVGEVCVVVGNIACFILSCDGYCCICLSTCCSGCFEGAKDEEIEIIRHK